LIRRRQRREGTDTAGCSREKASDLLDPRGHFHEKHDRTDDPVSTPETNEQYTRGRLNLLLTSIPKSVATEQVALRETSTLAWRIEKLRSGSEYRCNSSFTSNGALLASFAKGELQPPINSSEPRREGEKGEDIVAVDPKYVEIERNTTLELMMSILNSQ
jgi:hypothetical protein